MSQQLIKDVALFKRYSSLIHTNSDLKVWMYKTSITCFFVFFSFFFSTISNQDAPFVVKEKTNGTISYDGYCIDLLKELAKILKFTFEIYSSPDGVFGAETDEGMWNGVIGELVNEVCSQVISFLSLHGSR